MKIIKIVSLFLLFITSVLLPSIAFALDGTPDGDPSVSNIHGFKNLIETGDVAIFGEYDIPYSDNYPTVLASMTYTFQLITTANSTEVGAVTPFVSFDNGYNGGAFGMYFDSTDNLTFGGNYTLRIAQNPVHFDTPVNFDYEIPSASWTTAETQANNQIELAIAVIAAAERLEDEYTDYTLLESGLSATVLYSPTGETYFRGAFYGIQLLAPSLFDIQVAPYDTSDERVYTDNMTDNYTGRFTGTWVETDTEATALQFGLTPQAIMAMLFSLPVCLGFIIVSAKKFHKSEPGFIAAALVILVVYMMGWMPGAIFATVYQACGVYLAYVWFYARG